MATGLRISDVLISIHALREESDGDDRQHRDIGQDFYPRPPRGERPGSAVLLHEPPDISIHALREESDPFACMSLKPGLGISIHALREESDNLPL